MARSSRKEKVAFSNARELITCEILRSREYAVQYWGIRHRLRILKRLSLIFKLAVYNPRQSSPSLTISVLYGLLFSLRCFLVVILLLLRGPGLRTLYK